MTSRLASGEDVDRFYGARPAQTLQAVVILMGGEVRGILGVARHEDHAQFFSEFREELRPHLRTLPVMRAIKRAQAMVAASRLPVYARAEDTEPDATRILTRLGFVHHDGDTFRWPSSLS